MSLSGRLDSEQFRPAPRTRVRLGGRLREHAPAKRLFILLRLADARRTAPPACSASPPCWPKIAYAKCGFLCWGPRASVKYVLRPGGRLAVYPARLGPDGGRRGRRKSISQLYSVPTMELGRRVEARPPQRRLRRVSLARVG